MLKGRQNLWGCFSALEVGVTIRELQAGDRVGESLRRGPANTIIDDLPLLFWP